MNPDENVSGPGTPENNKDTDSYPNDYGNPNPKFGSNNENKIVFMDPTPDRSGFAILLTLDIRPV